MNDSVVSSRNLETPPGPSGSRRSLLRKYTLKIQFVMTTITLYTPLFLNSQTLNPKTLNRKKALDTGFSDLGVGSLPCLPEHEPGDHKPGFREFLGLESFWVKGL